MCTVVSSKTPTEVSGVRISDVVKSP